MMRNRNKKGHLAPKGWRNNRFNSINIKGDFAYCPSHNFVYDPREEERKLYNVEPCFYINVKENTKIFSFCDEFDIFDFKYLIYIKSSLM